MLLNENVTLLPESGISVKKRVGEFLEQNPSATLLHLDQSLMNMPLPEEVKDNYCIFHLFLNFKSYT